MNVTGTVAAHPRSIAMQKCDAHDADLSIDGVHYRFDTLAECKNMTRLRGTKGVHFSDYSFTLDRLEELHRQELARRRTEQRAS